MTRGLMMCRMMRGMMRRVVMNDPAVVNGMMILRVGKTGQTDE
jgi:hypothetical protein